MKLPVNNLEVTSFIELHVVVFKIYDRSRVEENMKGYIWADFPAEREQRWVGTRENDDVAVNVRQNKLKYKDGKQNKQ